MVLTLGGHERFKIKWVLYLTFVYLAGLGIEIIGVQTGFPFGIYYYGDVMGPKILGTPLLIGINWMLLVYSIGFLFKNSSINIILKVIISALLMVLLDYLIEPFAIQTGMWQWESDTIPMTNYMAWFLISALFFWIFYRFMGSKSKNLVAWVSIAWQFIFFLAV